MPSSTCRPAVPGFQTSGRWVSSYAVASCAEKTPARLIQPPRFVDTATSGAAVTMRSPMSGSRARAAITSPNACWVLALAGMRTAGGVDGATGMRCGSGRGVVYPKSTRRLASRRPSAESGAKAAQGSAGSAFRVGASASICSAVSIAEWFRLSPANGRRQPLMV